MKIICNQCGSDNLRQFLHNVNIDSQDYRFINLYPIKDRKIIDVKCNRCRDCGTIGIDMVDLHKKINMKFGEK